MKSTAIVAVTMPKWGIEMTEGTVVSWRVPENQRVERGADLVDVETEKIVNTVESPAAGVLRKITVGDGSTSAVGSLIGVIADAQTSDADIARFVGSFIGAVVSFEPTAAAQSAAILAPTEHADADTHVSPIARRLAEQLGVDLARIIGTGRNGRISKQDVEAFVARGAVPATPAQPENANVGVRRIRMSARRATIARRLLESKQAIPHFRLHSDVDFGPLLQLKRRLAAAGEQRVTANDLLLRAVALALVRHPMLNAQLNGEEILQFDNADIAIAVAAESGLITPVLRNANLKSLASIAVECRDLIERARNSSLRREEILGGSFTVSNLGMHGVTSFDAIINAPQVAILAVGSVAPRPWVRDGALAIAEVGTLTLSADHRVVDGAVGAAFLVTLHELLQHPDML